MNIIWISLYPPLPLNFGGPVGIYKRLIELQKNNNIYLFYINEDGNESYDQELHNFCTEVHSYPRNSITSINTLKYIFRLPYTAATRINKSMQNDIVKCIKHFDIDLINVEFPQMCANIFKIKKRFNIPVVLHEHNNEWNRFVQMAITVSGIKKILYKREARLLHSLEKHLETKGIIDHYTFLSDKDRDNFTAEFNIDIIKTSLVPLGADGLPLPKYNHTGKNIIFCAAMDSELNQEAAKWFVNKIYNSILKEVPDAFFYIVGRNPSEDIKRMNSDKVIVTGTVKDVKKYYYIADLIVIPLLHGGGVKVKLLEAVGYNRNIVTTSIGIEGTKFGNFKQILVADEADLFAEYCIRILNDDDYAKKLRIEMNKFFLENYTWEQIGKKYNELMNSIVQKSNSGVMKCR